MHKNFFMLNYGGPGGYWFMDNNAEVFSALDKACVENYGKPIRETTLQISGLNITVLTYGIHRSLRVDLPENAPKETQSKYDILIQTARNFCTTDYHLLNNNCVTSVATVLNALDSKITPNDVIFPWTLDTYINKYKYIQAHDATLQPFIHIYQKKLENQIFTPFTSSRLALSAIKSAKDIIYDAHSQDKTQRERTKSSLLELNWVIENKFGQLHPTHDAPIDLKIGLMQYNQESALVKKIKSLYQYELSKTNIKNSKDIFADNPDYSTALLRIHENINHLSEEAVSRVVCTISIEQAQLETPQISLAKKF